MKKRPLIPLLLILNLASGLIITALTGCQRETRLIRVNPAFRQYIQAFTSGIISTRSVIKVRMNDDYSDTLSLNMPLTEAYFEIRPAVKGKTYWSDRRTLEFRPDEPLSQDQRFTVSFYLSKLVAVPDSLKTMVFQVQTMKQEISITVNNYRAVSSSDFSREFLTGTLMTSDVADDQAVEATLKASQEGTELPVTWSHDRKNKTHIFQVDSIRRQSKAGEVKLTYNGDPIGVVTKGSLKVDIPSLSDFIVTGISSFPADQGCLMVQFSDLLDPGQNLDGLFRVGRYNDLRYSVEDNILWIYLPENQDSKLKVTLEPTIRNCQAKRLGKKVIQEVTIENTHPGIRFTGDGVILPSSNGMLLPFEAVNLNAVDIKVVRIFEKNIPQFLQVNELNTNSELARVGRIVLQQTMPLRGVTDNGKWNSFSIDLSTLIKTEPGALYSVILGFKKEYSTWKCSGSDSLQQSDNDMTTWEDPEKESDKEWGYYSNYYDDDFSNGGWRNYRWEERDNPCKPSYYFNKSINRNILASDLGIIAKAGDNGTYRVVVTDIVSSKPLSGVAVEFFNFQLFSIGKSVTGNDGMATVSLKKKPFLLVARSPEQTGYLKLSDGSALSLSMFDVGGEPVQKGIKGYLYGERGVWRPGDSLFLTFILEDKMKPLPPRHPVNFSLYSPSGQLMNRMVRTASTGGFYSFRTATSPSAPTGNWLAKVEVGGIEFRKMIRIETIKPNRLKILLDFKTDRLIKDKIPVAMLEASWLTGATARDLKAHVAMTLSKSVTAFPAFPGYVFDNPTAGFAAENITVFDGRLDRNGRTLITPRIHVTHVAPGALKATFETMVFEESGDFSIDRFTLPYFPFASYAGISFTGKGATEKLLNTGQQYNVNLVNVDARGTLIGNNTLKVEVYKLDWRWWWDDSEEGSADFISTAYLKPVDSGVFRTTGGKAIYPFRVSDEDWGRYLIKVTDKASGHTAGKVVYVDWPGYFRMPGGEKQAAAMLSLATDKALYKTGEKIRLTIPSAPDGRALISIENGSKVLKAFWVQTAKGATEIAIDATEEMAPNSYLFVTLIQPHAQSKNDLPVRLYGVVPVKVENPGTHLYPKLSLPSEFVPGKKATIAVSERTGRPMTYTLAVVDEGLLDLTRFKTPDAWSVFYAREALGVRTWDLYDQVIGAYSGELQRILSIGGDQEGTIKGSLKANRFVPMVKFLGPFELKRGETRNHSFVMPAYIGSVRVMVVAGKEGAYGQEEKTVKVKKPLMVLGTLPRVAAPGEKLTLPVSVFAMDRTIRKVTVEVEVNPMFTVNGSNTRQLTFTETGDQLVTFDLAVRETTGTGKVKIVAHGGNSTADHEIEIGVRNPNQRITNVQTKVIPAGGSWNALVTAPGMPGTNNGALELSSISGLALESRLDFLRKYPYGCLEQTVSAVFPLLYLDQFRERSDEKKQETAAEITALIQRIRTFQLPNGGLSYWSGGTYADDWATSYAGHFMMEAEGKGYPLPVNFLTAWKDFQRQKAISWSVNESYFNDDLVQAYRLFTLALAREPEPGSMNRLLEKKDLSTAARWQLAAAYAAAGKNEIAGQIISKTSQEVRPYQEMAGTFGSALRDKALIVNTLCMMNLRTRAASLVLEISRELESETWYNTQATAFGIMAVATYTGKTTGKGITAAFRQDTEPTVEIKTSDPVTTLPVEVRPGKTGVVNVVNKGKNLLYARLTVSGLPGTDPLKAAANGLIIDVQYKTPEGKTIQPWKLKQGTRFVAVVTVKNPGLRGNFQQLVLNEVFPSGWEILRTGEDNVVSGNTANAFNYQEVRDDRVYTHFDLGASRSKTFRVVLMAAYSGKFFLPAVTCEAMYDQTVNARFPGGWTEVIREEK